MQTKRCILKLKLNYELIYINRTIIPLPRKWLSFLKCTKCKGIRNTYTKNRLKSMGKCWSDGKILELWILEGRPSPWSIGNKFLSNLTALAWSFINNIKQTNDSVEILFGSGWINSRNFFFRKNQKTPTCDKNLFWWKLNNFFPRVFGQISELHLYGCAHFSGRQNIAHKLESLYTGWPHNIEFSHEQKRFP